MTTLSDKCSNSRLKCNTKPNPRTASLPQTLAQCSSISSAPSPPHQGTTWSTLNITTSIASQRTNTITTNNNSSNSNSNNSNNNNSSINSNNNYRM